MHSLCPMYGQNQQRKPYNRNHAKILIYLVLSVVYRVCHVKKGKGIEYHSLPYLTI